MSKTLRLLAIFGLFILMVVAINHYGINQLRQQVEELGT